ncbi:MAG: HNH endonuclease [Anaerolineales bacterium]|nr:HNH endonuclease [Anaerolineales bacterium]
MKIEKVRLTAELVRELFDYDEVDGWLMRKFKNGKTRPCGHTPTCNGYGYVRIARKSYLTHRIVWLWHHGTWPQNNIDHIDRDRMNNRIENLRVVNRSENQHNRGLSKNNTSGFPSVYWYKPREKYRVQIKVDNKKTHIGYFETFEEAYLAYQLAKIKMHPTSPLAQEYYRELTLAG